MSAELTPATLAALFGAMAVLAALPSTSVLAVTAQAAAHGFRAGAGVAAGVVAGDTVYILVALLGLSLVSDSLAPLAGPLRVAGGLYLIWLGWRVWRARPRTGEAPPTQGSSILTGLLITLGDQKAVLFYLGFFPAFLDLEHLGAADVLVVMLLAAVAVGRQAGLCGSGGAWRRGDGTAPGRSAARAGGRHHGGRGRSPAGRRVGLRPRAPSSSVLPCTRSS
jgi:threonine/homoserine/homoserine lactone efflux protein